MIIHLPSWSSGEFIVMDINGGQNLHEILYSL